MNNKFLVVIICWIISCPAAMVAQTASKKILTEKEYSLWHFMRTSAIASTGEWVAYTLHYSEGPDSVYVRSTKNKTSFSFSDLGGVSFAPNGNWFIGQTKAGLFVLQLSTSKQFFLPSAHSGEWSATGELIFTDSAGLNIRNLFTGKTYQHRNINNYQLSSEKTALTFTLNENETNHLYLLDISAPTSTILLDSGHEAKFTALAWQRRGPNLGFYRCEQGSGSTFINEQLVYVDRTGSYPKISRKNYEELADTATVFAQNPMILSDDGQTIFFWKEPKVRQQASDSIVQVWHGRDAIPYPQRNGLPITANFNKMMAWWPGQNKIMNIGSDRNPLVLLLGDQRRALTYHPAKSYPQFKQMEDVDVYLFDIESGQETLLIEDLENGLETQVVVSPGGRYVAYYHKKAWYLYDTKTRKHRPATPAGAQFEYPFAANNSDGSVYSFGYAGWVEGDEAFIVYDEWDCWWLPVDGSKAKRITDGADSETRFRVERNPDNAQWIPNFGGRIISLSEGMILEAFTSDRNYGYYRWKPATGLQKIALGTGKIHSIVTTPDLNNTVYIEESFDRPPQLIWKNVKGKSKILHQSNQQHNQFLWGKSTLHSFTNGQGKKALAALFYPADYVPGKKYPMIVNIYQRMSQTLHEYENPTNEMGAGLNTSVYTAHGYIVLCPDINYQPGEAGMSAFRDVEAAVKEVIGLGIVDEKHIGLTGHSFGGFETSFIVTQSKLFAAAIAGAPITDLVKGYFTINEEYMNTSDMWRFERQQHRFGFTLWENPDQYLRNSPVMHADKVETPLLLWTGMEDRNVHWHQSIEMYLALRRLNKPCILLVYPEEHHVLARKERKLDMCRRTMEWFDYYLKNEPAPDWISKPD